MNDTTPINVTSKIVAKPRTTKISPLEQIGQIDNRVAANHLFADYIDRKSSYTIANQAAALNLFGEYLGVVGIPGQSAANLQIDPNGTDPFRLQEAGGWASLAMPRRYVETAEVANKGVKLSG